jgi:hypothetical protein
MISIKILLANAMVFGLVAAGFAQSPPPDIYRAADTVLRNNRLNAEFAADPANAAVLGQIRRQAEKGDLKARVALLRIGDADTVAYCLDRLRARHWFDSRQAADFLGASGRLELIWLLGADLNIDEPTIPEVRITGEEHFKIPRTSVLAANVIQSLIRNSDSFPREVKRWAIALEELTDESRDKKRETVRVWWKQNERSLQLAQYGNTAPPN